MTTSRMKKRPTKAKSRAAVASSFTIKAGALVDESYRVFAAWDFAVSKRENLDRLRAENYIGARSDTWLRDISWVLHRRFDPAGRDHGLVRLAKAGCDLEVWKPLLLWHITRDEFLLRDFLLNWLFPAHEQGVFRLRSDDVHAFLRTISKRGGHGEHAWSDVTIRRVSTGLLKTCVDFGLLKGVRHKEFTTYHLPEQSFLYLLHAMREHVPSPRKLIDSREWRMFLMAPSDVEHELLRLHQFRKVEYEVAGSIVELKLPCASPAEFVERMVA